MIRDNMSQFRHGNTEFLFSFESPTQLEDWMENNPNYTGICMLGRSNVGKSSIINSLFGKKTAVVSKTPGRTRAVNIFSYEDKDHSFFLFDVPGYGFAQASKAQLKNWKVLMNTFFSLCSDKTLLINIQDSRHPFQKADLEFLSFILGYDKDFFIAFNKVDKLKTQKERSATIRSVKENKQKYPFIGHSLFVSAEKKIGVDDLEKSIKDFLKTTYS